MNVFLQATCLDCKSKVTSQFYSSSSSSLSVYLFRMLAVIMAILILLVAIRKSSADGLKNILFYYHSGRKTQLGDP